MRDAFQYVQAMERHRLWARSVVGEILVVIVVFESALEVVLRHDPAHGPRTSTWFAAPAIAVVILPLLARRRFPFGAPAAVWLIATAVSFVDGRLVTFPISAFVAALVASSLLGNLRDKREARLGLAIVLGAAVIVVHNEPGHPFAQLILIPVVFAIAWAAGFALRERGARAEAAERRANLAEGEREAAARAAAAAERARIARELHDTIAHAVSVIVLQVGAVRHKLPDDDYVRKDALRNVEQAGRTALTDMRHLLDAMRQTGEDVELAPQPGLGRLELLLEEVGRAGLPVTLQIVGDRVPLPGGLDISAYRIIQEALTNTLKHARARHAEVSIHYVHDLLRIEVRDDGLGSVTADGHGHGLVGIGERVKLYGGEMFAGTAEAGGFMLRAILPLT